MATGFKIAGGADISTLFEPLGSFTPRAATNFIGSGGDLANVFAPVANGSQIANNTGFTIGGTDLKAIFAGVGTTEAVKTFTGTEGDSYNMMDFINANPGSALYHFVINAGVTQPYMYYQGWAVNILIENRGTILGRRSSASKTPPLVSINSGGAAIRVDFTSGSGKTVRIQNYGVIAGGGGCGGRAGTSPASTYTYWTPYGGSGAGWDPITHTSELGEAGANGESPYLGGTGNTSPGGNGDHGRITLTGNTAGGGGGGGYYGQHGGAGGDAYIYWTELVELGIPGQPGGYAILFYNGTVPYSIEVAGTMYGGISTGVWENQPY
jgi:hypothetical protein